MSQKLEKIFKLQWTEENTYKFTNVFHLLFKVHGFRFAICSNKGQVDQFFHLVACDGTKLKQVPFNSKSTAQSMTLH